MSSMRENIHQEVVAELVKIIENLKQVGQIASNIPAKELALEVKKNIESKGEVIGLADIKFNQEYRMKMGIGCIAQANPALNFDYTKLLKINIDLPKDLKQLLSDIFKPGLEKKLELKNDPEKKMKLEKIDEFLDHIAKHLENKAGPEERNSANQNIIALKFIKEKLSKELEKEQEHQRIQQYGVDTHKPGAILKVLLVVCNNNEKGYTDNAMTIGDNLAAKSEKIDFGADPLGAKIGGILNFLADGVMNKAEEAFMQTFGNKPNESLSSRGPTPFSMKPTPPGGKG